MTAPHCFDVELARAQQAAAERDEATGLLRDLMDVVVNDPLVPLDLAEDARAFLARMEGRGP